MPRAKRSCAVVTAALLAGCHATPQTVAPPATITLTQAMRDTVDAMVETRDYSAVRRTNFRMRTCEVTAQFHVTATQTNQAGVTTDVGVSGAAAGVPVTLGLKVNRSETLEGERGSVVTLRLTSDDCVEWRFKAERAAGRRGRGGDLTMPIRPAAASAGAATQPPNSSTPTQAATGAQGAAGSSGTGQSGGYTIQTVPNPRR